MTPTVTISAVDHYGDQSGVRVLWGFINGVPVYMPFGTRGVRVQQAHRGMDGEKKKADPLEPAHKNSGT